MEAGVLHDAPLAMKSRPLLILLAFCALVLALPRFHAQQVASETGVPEDLHLYLLIGQSNMAGRAEIPEYAKDIIDRCYLLNDKSEWEPASNPLNRHSSVRKGLGMQKLGPGYSFVREMLAKDKNARIGIIVNARGGTKINEWHGKSELYREARKRTKAVLNDGTLKGVLWHQGESDQGAADAYLGKLQTLVANLRSDFNDPNLPFIAGQIHKPGAINDQIAKLPETTHATAVATAEGLTTTDGTHFDTKSQLLLGERYAKEMLRVQAALPPAPKPPSDIKFIDPHVHAMSVTPLGLRAVAKWMEERNVERCIAR